MLLPASSVCGLFKWRQFEPEVILLAVGWYLRFSLSYRDVEELLAERGPARRSCHRLEVGPALWPGNGTTFASATQANQRTVGGWMKPTSGLRGKWVYLYRAVDSTGATIDFLLSAKRDAAAAERFLAKALGGENHPAPRSE